MHDVVIVGAGPGGSTAAYYLAQAGLDVLLLDKFDFPRDKTCGDGLMPSALNVLADMGLLADLGRVSCRVEQLDVYAPNGQVTTATLPDYALVVPRLVLDHALCERAVTKGANFEGKVKVTAVNGEDEAVVVKGRREGRSFEARARVAIMATGASTGLLRRAGILTQDPRRMMVAARAYFEGLTGLNDRLRFYFDGVPLPGYGWVFPLPEAKANIGAGIFRTGWRAARSAAPPMAVFEQFIQTPPLRALLAQGWQVGPVKSYPLRIDFGMAPTYGDRLLLVGEAAGLVNPLTGEGIDYALESGKIAAAYLLEQFEGGGFSSQHLAGYDRRLRARFQSLFRFCYGMQHFLRRPMLNRLVKAANRHPDLKRLLVDVVQGRQTVAHSITPRVMVETLLALATTDFPFRPG